MQLIFLISLFVQAVYSQIFENDLPVSLQPPPPQQTIPRNDFSSIFPDVPAPIIPQQPQLQQQQPQAPKHIVHPTVLFTSEQEAKLPPNLLNPFYKNPRIIEHLAKQSWFTPGENLVTDRETEKIPRDKIYYALKSAGLVRRRRNAFYRGLR